jgi:hypothetical protein
MSWSDNNITVAGESSAAEEKSWSGGSEKKNWNRPKLGLAKTAPTTTTNNNTTTQQHASSQLFWPDLVFGGGRSFSRT